MKRLWSVNELCDRWLYRPMMLLLSLVMPMRQALARLSVGVLALARSFSRRSRDTERVTRTNGAGGQQLDWRQATQRSSHDVQAKVVSILTLGR